MWIIWKEEFKKIAARKIIWFSVVLLLGFITFRLYSETKIYKVTIDGKTYCGREAIRKDQELTKKYAGALTEEKIYQIYEEYGFYPYFEENGASESNFLNKYITDTFTNFRTMFGYDGSYDRNVDIYFYEGEEWERNAAPYLRTGEKFDYIYGWSDLVEIYMLLLIVLDIILIVGLSPVFSEEYMLKTADILRTTKRGKGSGIWMKVSAACAFSVLLTVLASLYLLGIYLLVYGTQGLNASPMFLSLVSFYGYCPKSVEGFLLFLAVLAVFGVFLLTGITLGYSSACRNSFLALILSAAVFLVPVFWVKGLLPLCQTILGPAAAKVITHFMVSMPVYLPMNTGFAFSEEQIMIHLGIAVAVGIFGMAYGYFRYRRCRN